MRLHFTWTITPNEEMQMQSRLLLASLRDLGVSTITVLEHEYDLVADDIRRSAIVVPYQPLPGVNPPWCSTPKFWVEPMGDVVIGLDSDVMVWREDLVLDAARSCLESPAVCGTIGYGEPFPEGEWLSLFCHFGMSDDFAHQYTNTNQRSPFYVNNGVVMMPGSFLPVYRKHLQKAVVECHEIYPKLYFMAQVAATVAMKRSGLPVRAMPSTFNYTENDNPGIPLLREVAFLHYNKSRSDPFASRHPEVRERAKTLSRRQAMPIKSQEEAFAAIRDILMYLNGSMVPKALTPSSEALSDFDRLKLQLGSNQWPEAVRGYLLCQNEDDKAVRAECIAEHAINFLEMPQGAKVLDYGCGDGLVVKQLASKGFEAEGYDPSSQPDWNRTRSSGPFDFIIVYDVLDHCEDPVAALLRLHDVCHGGTKIFCRTHPFTSPHAGHFYQKINKAYIQLVFSDQELKALGLEPDFKQRVYYPMADAQRWFDSARLQVAKHEIRNVSVDKFFRQNPLIARRIISKIYNQFPEWQMSQEFNDYILAPR